MIAANRDIFRRAVAAGARLRNQLGLRVGDAACPIDAARQLEIEVRFMEVASLEAMYCREPVPVIVVSSLRPGVRQVFNCAHELGHHVLGDERCITELVGEHPPLGDNRLLELAANSFAGEFLMAKSAILIAVKRNKLHRGAWKPVDILRLASGFGVGYETLVQQMIVTNLLTRSEGQQLLRRGVGDAKRALLGWHEPNEVVIMDEHFRKECVHVQVGDMLVVPCSWGEFPACVEPVNRSFDQTMLRATAPDVADMSRGSLWATTLYVARRGYVGSARYRYLQEVA